MGSLEKVLRRVWIDGWERGKKQGKTPYNYTLSNDAFLRKKWGLLDQSHKLELKAVIGKAKKIVQDALEEGYDLAIYHENMIDKKSLLAIDTNKEYDDLETELGGRINKITDDYSSSLT